MAAARHLSCPACRIRVSANARAIAVLENRCPLCGAELEAACSAAAVIGFRSFDLDVLSEQRSNVDADRLGSPNALLPSRKAASAQDLLDASRWEDDGGRVLGEVAVKW
jgi:hypothetical protein